MTKQEAVPAGIDPNTPSVARMYDYYLGGKDNFASDRAAAEQFMRVVPGIREMTRANRAFLSRVVELLVRQGVRQFLDIGSGLPTQDNVHQVAHRIAPDTRVVYVDNDPIVLVHGRALLEENHLTSVIQGDMREPEKLLTDPQIESAIDFTQPVAVLLISMLHFIPDDALVAHIITTIRERLAPGSHLIVTHAFEANVSAEVHEAGQQVYRSTSAGALTSRGPEQLAELLSGMELLEPGIVPVEAWRSEYNEYGEKTTVDFTKPGILGVVGRS
ncbi:SAM-dependent methyltransferase [Streptosporangium sp. NPDC006013]|uniref:SAM-dependent methyltransferase n=1 Tax=Streptosporangium sp. NPDC006013 TaxID=3155596 RepID=UPI0033A75714